MSQVEAILQRTEDETADRLLAEQRERRAQRSIHHEPVERDTTNTQERGPTAMPPYSDAYRKWQRETNISLGDIGALAGVFRLAGALL